MEDFAVSQEVFELKLFYYDRGEFNPTASDQSINTLIAPKGPLKMII